MNEIEKPYWVNTKWREVEWATRRENKHLDYWHLDLFHWTEHAMECARDYWQDEKIDVKDLTLEEEENSYFAYLACLLCSDCFMDKETTTIARKFFKNLGVQW